MKRANNYGRNMVAKFHYCLGSTPVAGHNFFPTPIRIIRLLLLLLDYYVDEN